MRGRVAWFDRSFGFIIQDDGGPDVFVHHSQIMADGFRSLEGGEKVEYELGVQDKTGKPIAVNVRKLGGS